MTDLQAIAQEFAVATTVLSVQSYGAGNVNDTYLVTLAAPEPALGADRFILQRINQNVFPQPELILLNMRTFTDYMRQRLAQEGGQQKRRWEVPLVIRTRSGADYLVDQAGGFWRAISLVERAKTYPRIRDASHARESGYARR